MMQTDYNRIFAPERVAVVGVSAQGFGFGSGILQALLTIGFEGRLYPVSAGGGSFAGLTLYRCIAEIPEDIDFGIIAIPASDVPAAVEACRRKGAAGVEILSAGFREAGTPEGRVLEDELKAIAQKGIRIIGPNCFGIYAPHKGLTVLPGPDLPRETGPVSVISQSGGLTIDLLHAGRWRGLRFNKAVSFGNGVDLRETELLAYLGQDDETRVICMYVEGVEDGRRFFEVLKTVARQKPVIVYKGGLSEAGSRAVASHTASLSGNRTLWEAMLRQCNALQVYSLEQMAETAMALCMLPPNRYQGLAVIGGGGALGVAAADAADAHGLFLPGFTGEIEREIDAVLPKPGSSAANPVDVANPYVAPADLKKILCLAARDDRVDVQILVYLIYHYKALALALGTDDLRAVTPYGELADMLGETLAQTQKPIVLIMPNHRRDASAPDIEPVYREARDRFIEKGIPVFENLEGALAAISRVARYARGKRAQDLGA